MICKVCLRYRPQTIGESFWSGISARFVLEADIGLFLSEEQQKVENHMTLEQLANVGEALGGIAVIISLIYLIIELRRNTRSVQTAAAWNADVSLAELNEGLSHSPQLSELTMRALDPKTQPEDLTPAEFAQFMLVSRSVLQKYQAQWWLWKRGSLSDEMWQLRRRWAKAFISLPVPGDIWQRESNQHQFANGFMDSINSAEVLADLRISR